jgi:uncharacterized lipoprotein NlpE involved in copper resistance
MAYINKNVNYMKKIFFLSIAVASIVACNNGNETSVTSDTTTVMHEDNHDATANYTASEGDVTYRDNKVMVMKNGEWVETNDEVTLDNGVVVHKNGQVKRNDDVVVMHDGEIVTRSGNFFDRSGRAIDNAWDATKEGVKDAGRAIKNTAEKIGEGAERAVDHDKDGH